MNVYAFALTPGRITKNPLQLCYPSYPFPFPLPVCIFIPLLFTPFLLSPQLVIPCLMVVHFAMKPMEVTAVGSIMGANYH
jgi:hypothetical protein